MSWSVEEHIGECRPWPAQVVVYRGETGECLAYVSGEVADRLQAENAKLREYVTKLEQDNHRLDSDNCDLLNDLRDMQFFIDENRKLRELVVEVFECARRGAACETCKVNNDGYACVYIMRELGVEVDG